MSHRRPERNQNPDNSSPNGLAGWFEEEREGYRVYVAVPPVVSQVWTALMEVARPDKVFYGGMVLSIHNNLQQALAQPEEQALALRQAAVEAKCFLQHLNAMIYGLKGLLDTFSNQDDHRRPRILRRAGR